MAAPSEEEVRQVRARMQAVAKVIEGHLPKGYGFFLLAFPFNAPPEARGEYVSNAQWSDVSKAMQQLLMRRGVPLDGGNN